MKTFLFIFLIAIVAYAEEERRIWPEEYLKPQPETKSITKTAKAKPKYKKATPQISIKTVSEDTVIGVTIWRLRPTDKNLDAATQNWIAERIEGDTKLLPGDRVRLSIEAARDGYLYVIDREQYAEGKSGKPVLIFPTSRLSQGENKTSIGRVIEIPSQNDNPPYFTLTPGSSDQIAEVISVLVTPEPLKGLQIEHQPSVLSAAQVAEWENSWGKNVGRLEMVDGAGQTITVAEIQAGAGARLLTHTDPLPQSIYYAPDANLTQPSFINVRLQYSDEPR